MHLGSSAQGCYFVANRTPVTISCNHWLIGQMPVERAGIGAASCLSDGSKRSKPVRAAAQRNDHWIGLKRHRGGGAGRVERPTSAIGRTISPMTGATTKIAARSGLARTAAGMTSAATNATATSASDRSVNRVEVDPTALLAMGTVAMTLIAALTVLQRKLMSSSAPTQALRKSPSWSAPKPPLR